MCSKKFLTSLLVFFAWQISSNLQAAIYMTGAVQDNTLYESPTGALSNGAGDFIFAGRVGGTGGFLLRRGLVQFNTAPIPVGSTINSVTLMLTLGQAQQVGASDVSLNRVTRSWGEGTSNAPGNEGQGAASTNGDATWIHNSFPGSTWTTPGGDFNPAASATITLNASGSYTWGSTAGMVADVQQWVNNPNANFGWMLIGNEALANTATAMQFVSRTGPGGTTAQPNIRIDFTPVAVPEPTSGLLVFVSAGVIGLRRWRSRSRVKQ